MSTEHIWQQFGKPHADRATNERRAAIARAVHRLRAASSPPRVVTRTATRWVSESRDDAPCSRCGADIGRPCTSPSGRRTRPHAERIAAAKAGRP